MQRGRPHRLKLNWADRALLAALLSVIPKARRHGLQLLVTPETILRWHRDIVRRRWAIRSMRGKPARTNPGAACPEALPARRTRLGLTACRPERAWSRSGPRPAQPVSP
jgi:hypothetical protein